TPQAFTPRRLTARPAESEHLEGKSTTTHYLVNSNKVCENSLFRKDIDLEKGQFVRTYINERFVERLKKKWNLVSKSRKDMLYINIMNDKNIYIL
ncbi:hypothetical protein SOP93_25355, partial [Peribacillus frigoritolerans]|uniref:hypothetical protein n=1 Tax=Peribacillus frigoritolerans TaxID=450367 RepID=UPI002B246D0E